MCSITDLCFMCSNDDNDNKCNVVDNNIVTQVEYLMPEISITKLKLPLRICSTCEKNIHFFNTFKKDCVENSRLLEARIKEAQENTELIDKYSTSDTNINKLDDVDNSGENESDNLEVKCSLFDEIFIKEELIQENPYNTEFVDVLQATLKEETPQQTGTHLPEDISVDMEVENDQNFDDLDDVFSDNEINENILVSGSANCKIYTCLICKKDFKDLSYLKSRHMNIHFGKKFQCTECRRCFSYKSSLVTHMKRHTGMKDFQCNECKKWFAHKSHLVRHIKQHTGEKDFQCKECKKCFSQKSDLARHMIQHTGVKGFQCNECKKCFSRRSHLATHMKQHIGVKGFQCNECKQWFLQESDLVRHMKQHIGVKRFQCNECKKWFLHKSRLDTHMKQHTGVKDFQCNECKKWFGHKSHFVTHMKQHNEKM